MASDVDATMAFDAVDAFLGRPFGLTINAFSRTEVIDDASSRTEVIRVVEPPDETDNVCAPDVDAFTWFGLGIAPIDAERPFTNDALGAVTISTQ